MQIPRMITQPVILAGSNFGGEFHHKEEMGAVCIPNISPEERKKREKFAIRYFILTLVVLGALIVLGVNPLWRLPLFFMFSAATTSYIQALDKT